MKDATAKRANKYTKSTGQYQDELERLGRLNLSPLSLEEALRGAMQVGPIKEHAASKEKPKKKSQKKKKP